MTVALIVVRSSRYRQPRRRSHPSAPPYPLV